MSPSVGIVIVNHNLKDSLRETLRSFHNVYPRLQIVVSDNASTDGSQAMVEEEFPEVYLAAHKTELGYAKAASLGMATLSSWGVKYIFSTTNDVIVERAMITRLVEFAEAHPAVGIIGCKIFYYGKKDRLWHAGGRIHPLHGHSYHYGWNRSDGPRYSQVRECDYVTGCGLFVRSDLAVRAGYYNPKLFFYCEDADLCYRVRALGYRVVYLPTARMWHKTSTTLAKNRPLQLAYSTRNTLFLLQWHKIGYYPISLAVYILAVCPFKMLVFLCCLRWRNSVAICFGIYDWFLGRLGEYEP